MIKFKIKGLDKDIELELESYSIINEVESYNIETGEACILFELNMLDGTKQMLGVDINIKGLILKQIQDKAIKQLEKEFKSV
jgi:hypothetical protein